MSYDRDNFVAPCPSAGPAWLASRPPDEGKRGGGATGQWKIGAARAAAATAAASGSAGRPVAAPARCTEAGSVEEQKTKGGPQGTPTAEINANSRGKALIATATFAKDTKAAGTRKSIPGVPKAPAGAHHDCSSWTSRAHGAIRLRDGLRRCLCRDRSARRAARAAHDRCCCRRSAAAGQPDLQRSCNAHICNALISACAYGVIASAEGASRSPWSKLAMRPGFLVEQAGAQTAAATQQHYPQPGSTTVAAAAHRPARAAAAAAASGAPPPARTPEQLSAGLAECLELLKGPSDERRCRQSQLLDLEGCPCCLAAPACCRAWHFEQCRTPSALTCHLIPSLHRRPVTGLWACCW